MGIPHLRSPISDLRGATDCRCPERGGYSGTDTEAGGAGAEVSGIEGEEVGAVYVAHTSQEGAGFVAGSLGSAKNRCPFWIRIRIRIK